MYGFVILSILIAGINKDLTQRAEFISPIWMFASELGHLGLSALSVEGNGMQSVRGAGLYKGLALLPSCSGSWQRSA